MRVRLADVGDPLAASMFEIGRGGRFRSMRNGATGGGGGTGEGEGGDGGEGDADDADEDDADDADEGEGGGEDDKDKKQQKNPELEKAIRARDRAKERARKLQEELDKTRQKDEKPDPVAAANAKLVRAEAKSQLAALGVTDKDDVAAVLGVLKLDDIEVDEDGEPDSDTIEERVTELKRIFGGAAEPKKRTPRSTSTRDKGGNNRNTSDPDAARYAAFLGHR